MATAPPALLVAIMDRMIPPAAREAVIGDLWESYRSPLRFLGQGLALIPWLVLAQVRRWSSWPILGLQLFILFACLGGFRPGETMPLPWLRALLPASFAFLAFAWHDAYRRSRTGSALRTAAGEMAATAIGVASSQLVIAVAIRTGALSQAWLLGRLELLVAASALPILCLFRWGPSLADAPAAGGEARLESDYARFRAQAAARNRLEIGAMLATLLISWLLLARLPGPVPPAVRLTLAGFVGLVAFLAWRGGAARPRPGGSAEDLRRLYRRELIRQGRLRSLLVWYWLSPLFLGLATHFLVDAGGEWLAPRRLVGVLLIGGLATCIAAFNAERIRLIRRKARGLGAEA